MRKRWFLMMVVVVLLGASLACGKAKETPTPEPTAVPPTATPAPTAVPAIELGEQVRNEAGGFAFQVIPDYDLFEEPGFVDLVAPDGDADLGPLISFIGGYAAEGTTAEELMGMIEGDEESELKMSPPEDLSVGGYSGLMADLSSLYMGEPIEGRVVVVIVDDMQQFVMFGGAPESRWESELLPYFEAVLETVEFFEAEEVFVPDDVTEGEELRQWASSASASSEYSSPGWSAEQATGAPDTDTCGDHTTAWASETSDGVDWLEVYYEYPVIPQEINVLQTYMPSQVTEVEVIDSDGSYYVVYSAIPEKLADEDCPFTLSIAVADIDFQVSGLRVSLDQAVLDDASWNEIDAVELVGLYSGEVSSTPLDFDPPAGFLWRYGGETGFEMDAFGSIGGMVVGPDGLLYVSDDLHGVYVMDTDGVIVSLIEHDDLYNAGDVAFGPDGNLYVADWGSNQVFIFQPDGEFVAAFGSEGTGDGEFGIFSPQSIDFAPDGNLYILDENENAQEESYDRVQVFSAGGEYLAQFTIDAEYFAASDLAFGPDGNLYTVGFIGDYLIQYDLDGNVLGELGMEALEWTGPQRIVFDDAGNIYVSVWTPDGVIKLDSEGNKIGHFGVTVEDGDVEWPEGGFYQPEGVAVSSDGEYVFASDWSGDFAYITAFMFE